MNQYLKYVGIGLLIIFILWNIIITFIAFMGCPPTYVIFNTTYNESGDNRNLIHISQQDNPPHSGLVEAFSTGKRILLPIGTVTDLIPGSFFGPNYANTRVPVWERGYLEKNYISVWEYNGSYYHFAATLC
jgi:hypothetical protein